MSKAVEEIVEFRPKTNRQKDGEQYSEYTIPDLKAEASHAMSVIRKTWRGKKVESGAWKIRIRQDGRVSLRVHYGVWHGSEMKPEVYSIAL